MHNNKTFSSANLALTVPLLVGFCTYFYLTIDNFFASPVFCGILLFIITMAVLLTIFLKFPLFIADGSQEIENKSFYEDVYTQNISWWKCLYFCIIEFEPSRFISFFSGVKLTLYVKGRICKFCWENKPVKWFHHFLDIILMIILSFLSFFAAIALTDHSWGSSTVIFLIFLIIVFRKQIISYSFSINVSKFYDCRVNVIYPYSTSRFHLFKYYGMAILFNKTILITEDTFRLNPVIKEYVLNHERGHLLKSKLGVLQYIAAIFALISLTFIPEILTQSHYDNICWIPLFLFLIYNVTIGYRINLKSELSADENAIKALGKQKVLEALNIIKDSKKTAKRSLLAHLLFRYVPIERRIKFVNEYTQR